MTDGQPRSTRALCRSCGIVRDDEGDGEPKDVEASVAAMRSSDKEGGSENARRESSGAHAFAAPTGVRANLSFKQRAQNGEAQGSLDEHQRDQCCREKGRKVSHAVSVARARSFSFSFTNKQTNKQT